ncbi:MAG: tetratricopeptide repeat protein, partial [Hyphomicrobiales bacterium]|nr:tetratricopeptide repeat protein [Hyphomicrobiales bacterium]
MIAGLFAVSLWAEISTARADVWDDCHSGSGDTAIQACTRLIKGARMARESFGPAYYKLGRAYLEKQDYEEAVANLTQAIEHSYEKVDVLFQRGVAYRHLGQNDEALADFSRALDLDRNFEPAYLDRGRLYTDLGRYDEALLDFANSLRLKPDRPETLYYRADAHRRAGAYDNAISGYTEALRYDRNYADAYNDRGGSSYAKGRFEDAIADFDKAIELAPNMTVAYFNRGVTFLLLGRDRQAHEDLQRYFELNPAELGSDYNWVCWELALNRQADRALPYCDRSLALSPDQALAWDSRAFVRWQRGEFDLAHADLAEARKRDPELVDFDRRFEEYRLLLLHLALLHHGYEPGIIDDGREETRNRIAEAIKDFQAKSGLTATGTPSLETLLHLVRDTPIPSNFDPALPLPGLSAPSADTDEPRPSDAPAEPEKEAPATQSADAVEPPASDEAAEPEKALPAIPQPQFAKITKRYQLRAQGRGMIIDGQLVDGIVDDVRAAFEAVPDLRTVLIDSKGGSLKIGIQLFDLFLEKGVDTYTFDVCQGVCVVAFLGGKRRTVHPDAALGVFPISFGKQRTDRQRAAFDRYLQAEADRLRRQGIDGAYIEKMQAVYTGKTSWTPPLDDLRAWNAVTAVDTAFPADLHGIVINLPVDDKPESELYTLEIDGSTLRISGRFGWGLDKAVEAAFDKAPEIRTVELDSLGGRTMIGLRLYDFFLKKGINTFVKSQCGSACTTA